MKKQLLAPGIICLAVTGMLMFNACSNKSEDDMTPPNNCVTTNMSYTSNVLPIIKANCYSCHGNGTVTGGINLDGYDNLKVQVDNGNLKGAITHASGYTPMPYNQPKLSDCDINKILSWIDDGAANN